MLAKKINYFFHNSTGKKKLYMKVKFNYALYCLKKSKAKIIKGYLKKNQQTFYGFKVYLENTSWHFPNFSLDKKQYNKLKKYI